jgi:hypothetical protein
MTFSVPLRLLSVLFLGTAVAGPLALATPTSAIPTSAAPSSDRVLTLVTLKNAQALLCTDPLSDGGLDVRLRLDARKARVPVRAAYRLDGNDVPFATERTGYLKGKRTKKLPVGGVDAQGALIYSVKVTLQTRGGAKRSAKAALTQLPAC